MEDSIRIRALSCSVREQIYPSEYLLVLALSEGITTEGGQQLVLRPGELLFLAPYSGCSVGAEGGSSLIYAEITKKFTESMIGAPKHHLLRIPQEAAPAAAQRLVELYDLYTQEQGATALKKTAAAVALLQLLEPVITVEIRQISDDNSRGAALRQYLLQHFREPIQLSDLAEAFGISRQHMSGVFHRELGTSFQAYLQALRANEAGRLLQSTELSIAEISSRSGFPNQKSFASAIRKQFGMTPREYRRNGTVEGVGAGRKTALQPERENTELNRCSGMEEVSRLLQPYRMAYSRSSELIRVSETVQPADPKPFSAAWRDILNIDHPAACMHAAVQGAIAELQQDMQFRYVRLTNLWKDELIPYYPGSGHRYTWLLSLLDFFREINLTPMLCFGDSYSISHDFVMLNESPYGIDQQDWLSNLKNLLEISLRHWGAEWVGSWRFEFHMPARLYDDATGEHFLRLLEESTKLIRRLAPGAEIGGPAMSADAAHMERWRTFLQGVGHRQIPLDYISAELWAEYSVETDSFPGQFQERRGLQRLASLRNADAEVLLDRVNLLREHMDQAGLQQLKLYISALGVTKYQAQAAQLGGHCPAFLVRCITALQDHVDGIGCWKAVNDEAEYDSEFCMLSSGCGLVSRSNLRNPAWYAYRFLARQLALELSCGSNTLVTADGSGSYAVLVNNCRNYSDYFCSHYLDAAALDFTDSRLYRSGTALQQTVEFPGTGGGSWKVRQYLVGDHHGNIAWVLRQMGRIDEPTASEIQYIAGQSMPYQYTWHAADSEQLRLTVTLQPNELMLLLVTPEQSLESDE